MKIYKVTNEQTHEEFLFKKKTNLVKSLGINQDRLEMAVMSGTPINKRNGVKFKIEYRDLKEGEIA